MNIRRTRVKSLVACAAGVACLALTATACSSGGSSSSSSSSAAATTSAPAATSAAATTPAATATGSTGSSADIPASLTGTAKTIATNWVTFFDAKTPAATKISLLQNGSTFSTVIQGEASNAQAQTTGAKVDAVTVSGSTATVTWDLLLSGTPMLNNQKGEAVLNNGVWQVSDTSFCGLLSLQPPAPAVCKA